MTSPLILASSSPRRSELLQLIDLDFIVQPAEIEEVYLPEFTPEENAERLALQKCSEIAAKNPSSFVLAADTLVFLKDKVLGKPQNPKEAEEMLQMLSGQRHRVVTGVALLQKETETCFRGALSSYVTFREIDPDEISRYVATGEPLDKSGAYAIQGGAAPFVQSTDGSLSNIIGLPLMLVLRFMMEIGLDKFLFKE